MLAPIETALLFHQRGCRDQAARLYDSILAEDPDHADALHLRGVLFLQAGDAETAARCIERAIALKPDAALFHANLAEALRALGALARAIDCWREVHRLAPQDPKPFDRAGLLFLMQGKAEAAAEAFRQALQLDPDSALHHDHLGNALRLLGDQEGALARFRRAVALDGASAETRSNLGQLLLERGEPTEALTHCREAVRLRPGFPEALNNLGNALRELGRLDEAKAAYAEALRLDPGLAMTWNNLGQALQGEGQPEQALAWYDAAIEAAPDAARFQTHRASALAELGREEEAAAGYESALRLDRSAIEAYCGLGRLRDDQGRHAEALKLLHAAVDRRPDSAGARVQLAALLAEVGEFEAAEASLREALRLDGRHVAALAALADLNKDRLLDADLDAICQLLTERELSPGNAAALHFSLARVLDAREAYTLATEHFRLGNALRCQAMTPRGELYRPELQQAFIDGVIAAHPPEFFDRVRGFGLEPRRPVFIFGLPRSGTTLVEQILASHPQVFGAGELKLVRDALRSLPRIMGRGEGPLACLPDLDPPSVRTLAQATSMGSTHSTPRPTASPTRCPRTSSPSA
jgi:tetratricopeptide (TPR) repeat protein